MVDIFPDKLKKYIFSKIFSLCLDFGQNKIVLVISCFWFLKNKKMDFLFFIKNPDNLERENFPKKYLLVKMVFLF